MVGARDVDTAITQLLHSSKSPCSALISTGIKLASLRWTKGAMPLKVYLNQQVPNGDDQYIGKRVGHEMVMDGTSALLLTIRG